MAPASYQLDTVATHLLTHLEGARRTWLDDPFGARAGLTRIASESVDRVVAEHDQVMGDADGWGPVLRREVMETFLPRYLRLAVAQNAQEAAGFGTWRGGDPVARITLLVGAILIATLLRRLLMFHPITLIFYGVALLAPLLPSLRARHQRRRYQRSLQEVLDDLARIQVELDRHPPEILERPSPAARPAAMRIAAPPPKRQR